MKKIIALILATLMVMCALAACGSTATSGTTAGTTAGGTTAGTTAATQPTNPPTSATTATTEAPKPVEPYKVVCYYPFGENPKAVNVATGEVLGAITAASGVELKGGYIYVVNVVPADSKAEAIAEVGTFVAEKEVSAGWTNVKSNGGVTKYTSYILKDKASTTTDSKAGSNGATIRKFMYNCYIDEAALNTAMGEYAESLGKFGTLTFKLVDGDISTFMFDGAEGEETLTDYKNWNFVYVNYDGTAMKKATGTSYTPVAMNAKDIIYSAIDKALGNEIGTLRQVWVTAMDTYGGLPSVLTDNGKYNGTTQQQANLGAFTNSIIPTLYSSAVTKYNALVEAGKTEASIAAALAAANTALDAAKAAYDAAIAANADVKALNDAYVAAAAALAEAKQAEYEARAAFETAKAQSGSSSEQAKALEPAYNDAKAATATAQTANDTAKAALDAAIAADANLKALADELVVNDKDTFESKADIQKAANTDQTNLDNYKKYVDLYAKFTAAYDELANVALWDVEDMENSAINKYFKSIDAEKISYPTFTYYYDAATDTYTVFVTSVRADNMVTFFSNNNAVPLW